MVEKYAMQLDISRHQKELVADPEGLKIFLAIWQNVEINCIHSLTSLSDFSLFSQSRLCGILQYWGTYTVNVAGVWEEFAILRPLASVDLSLCIKIHRVMKKFPTLDLCKAPLFCHIALWGSSKVGGVYPPFYATSFFRPPTLVEKRL